MTNRSTRITASTLGVVAGLVGGIHGVSELLQGPGRISFGPQIYAIGPPCQPEAMWHACLPALSLLPSYQLTGVAALLVSAAVLLWALLLVGSPRGGLVLIGLAVLMIPLGAGFIPAFIGIIAGVAGSRIHAELRFWRRLPARLLAVLAALWPWLLGVYLVEIVAQWVLGALANDLMLALGAVTLPLEFLLLAVIVLSAYARDIVRRPML